MLVDSLRCDAERAAPLAALIHEKTTGNPFFAIQFILALADEGLLTFDFDKGRWIWDLPHIRAKGFTENVVELMVGKLGRLPPATQKALQHFACMGNSATVEMLGMVHQGPVETLHEDLWDAVRSGLIFRADDSYRFLHDRVQEAAYSLIPTDLRAESHLHIGLLLATHTPPAQRDERSFEIVNQLNRGSHLISSIDERERVAELNLIAGRRARNSAAYESALKYLRAGRALLTEETWTRNYDILFSIEYLMAECEVLTADMAAAEDRLLRLTPHTNNRHDLCLVTRLRLTLYTALDQSNRGVEVFLDWLRQEGTVWPRHPTRDDARREYDRIWTLLGNRRIEDLVDLPLVADTDFVDTMDIFAEMVTPTLFFDEHLSSLVVCRMVNLSLEHGNCDGSCFGYTWFSMFAGPRFDNYEDGYRFGQLGFDLVEQRGLTRHQARTYITFGNAVVPWKRHAASERDLIRRAFDLAYRAGDLTFAAYRGEQLTANYLVAGDPLAEVQAEAEHGLAFGQRVGFGYAIHVCGAELGLVRTLRGLTPQFGCLDYDSYSERDAEGSLARNPVLSLAEFCYWTRKMQARFFAGDFVSAVEASREAQRLQWTAPSQIATTDFRFYAALAHAAAWHSATPEARVSIREALADHHAQLEVWAKHCPANFAERTMLVRAELARIEDRLLDAERLYEDAIRLAHANGSVHNEAVSSELAGRFYAARGFDRIANGYFRDARYCYLRWGAEGKVRQLDERHPQARSGATADATATIQTRVDHLDLATVIKVSEAVSGEIVLETLVGTIMRTAIEHAGAERGLLLLPHGDGHRIEAEALTSSDQVTVVQRQAAITPADLPGSVLQYVLRTKQRVVLHHESDRHPFADDEYFREHRARSLLCLPLLKQARVLGLLYLENNLTSHAFTPARMAVLELLASAAAISMENTRLYGDLQEREARVRRLVDSNIVGVMIWSLDGRILEANDAFLDMLQYRREDIVAGGVRWTELTPPEWRQQDERATGEVKATGTVQPYEKEFIRKDGSRIAVLTGGALFDARATEGVAFALDLTKQKQAEAEIRALKDQLYRENLALRDEVDRALMFEEIIGSSSALKAALSRIAKVAPTDSTVFITGETGTGKELMARAVHKRSRRSGRAFVSVNCAALAPALISSELFGHERGSFTGATQRRLGRFELADGGTIFLDEVGELPPDTQIALLRVLQEREFERLGGTQTIRVDVRVIAATNRDLAAAVAGGAFREDLFYRLNVFPIEVPPLRHRREDILTLVEYFVQRFATRAGRSFRAVERTTLERLQAYDWPGNIRELQNVIERSVILSPGEVLVVDESWLSKESDDRRRRVASPAPSRDEPRGEREIIEGALSQCRGRVAGPSGAAAVLGVPPSTLENRIRALGIDKKRFKFR
jgi:PAS domain S-box-containing protein